MEEIYNPLQKKTRQVKDIQSFSYEDFDDKGQPTTARGVKYTVVGNNREWKDWMPKDLFEEHNPTVKFA